VPTAEKRTSAEARSGPPVPLPVVSAKLKQLVLVVTVVLQVLKFDPVIVVVVLSEFVNLTEFQVSTLPQKKAKCVRQRLPKLMVMTDESGVDKK